MANVEFLTVPETLFRAKALATSTGTYTGDWHDVASARDFGFWFRMTSAGSPSVKISVDVSPFPRFTADKWAIPIPAATQPSPPYNPDTSYLTIDINDAFTTVWNGSDANGGWTFLAAPPAMHGEHYASLRYRVVVTVANVTAGDFVMTRAAR